MNIKSFVDEHIKENITVLIEDLKQHYYHELYGVFYRIIVEDNQKYTEEAIEFWTVSEQLFRKLKKHGEATLKWKGLNIWGRTATCGAVRQDEVIIEIHNSYHR